MDFYLIKSIVTNLKNRMKAYDENSPTYKELNNTVNELERIMRLYQEKYVVLGEGVMLC